MFLWMVFGQTQCESCLYFAVQYWKDQANHAWITVKEHWRICESEDVALKWWPVVTGEMKALSVHKHWVKWLERDWVILLEWCVIGVASMSCCYIALKQQGDQSVITYVIRCKIYPAVCKSVQLWWSKHLGIITSIFNSFDIRIFPNRFTDL